MYGLRGCVAGPRSHRRQMIWTSAANPERRPAWVTTGAHVLTGCSAAPRSGGPGLSHMGCRFDYWIPALPRVKPGVGRNDSHGCCGITCSRPSEPNAIALLGNPGVRDRRSHSWRGSRRIYLARRIGPRSRCFSGKSKPNEAMPIKRAARNELDFPA